jgi:transposase-like protein
MDDDKLLALRNAGKTIKEIARELGVNPSWVERRLGILRADPNIYVRRFGGGRIPSSGLSERQQKMVEVWNTGQFTHAGVAAQFGLASPVSVVWNLRKARALGVEALRKWTPGRTYVKPKKTVRAKRKIERQANRAEAVAAWNNSEGSYRELAERFGFSSKGMFCWALRQAENEGEYVRRPGRDWTKRPPPRNPRDVSSPC